MHSNSQQKQLLNHESSSMSQVVQGFDLRKYQKYISSAAVVVPSLYHFQYLKMWKYIMTFNESLNLRMSSSGLYFLALKAAAAAVMTYGNGRLDCMSLILHQLLNTEQSSK